MKKCLLFLTLPLVLFCSCTKENNSKYYITCDIDGVHKFFDVTGAMYNNGPPNYLRTYGAVGVFADTENIYVEVQNVPRHKVIRTGTYADTSSRFEARIGYTAEDRFYYEGGTYLRSIATQMGNTVNSVLVITITYLSENAVAGTFAGDCFVEVNPSGAVKHITNGKFHVPFHK